MTACPRCSRTVGTALDKEDPDYLNCLMCGPQYLPEPLPFVTNAGRSDNVPKLGAPPPEPVRPRGRPKGSKGHKWENETTTEKQVRLREASNERVKRSRARAKEAKV